MRRSLARWAALISLAAFSFPAQVVTSAVSPYQDLSIQAVSLPVEVKAGAYLTIKVLPGGGGCTTYDRMTVTRSSGKINLQLQMLRRRDESQPCTLGLETFPVRYMETLFPSAGSNGMGDKVAVSVNGKLAGVVRIVR
ncbi:hypothetical protein [Deinococcus puniceus]|uniref:hypothetical protein n=1 Tax=Deinococcus puniceus TaxID=1182568 RepID=UPI000A786595|nr:hypothetical protein [Deinococcus puniceus]